MSIDWMIGLVGFLALVLVELVTRRHETETWIELCDLLQAQRDEWQEVARALLPPKGKES